MSIIHRVRRIISYIKHHKILSGITLLILVILVYVFFPKPQPPIQTQEVSRKNLIQSVAVNGSVIAKKQVDLSFLSSGTLIYVGAKKGDMVSTGETIAAIDQRTILKNLQNALLIYSEQRNTFDQTIDNNQGRTVDQAISDAMKRILQNNQYDLNKAVISVELQDLAKQQSALVSPIDGILTRTDEVTPGATVTTTSTFTITDPGSLVFAMDVDEADIGKISIGETVNMTFDAYPTETITLPIKRIDFVSHTSSNGGNVFTVEVQLPMDTHFKYRVGMNGNAEIITAEKDNVLTVPLGSIVDNNNIFVKTKTGFLKTVIKLGLENDTDAEVLHGLSEGDMIAVQPSKIPSK
jgi:HlyD family secretion protein